MMTFATILAFVVLAVVMLIYGILVIALNFPVQVGLIIGAILAYRNRFYLMALYYKFKNRNIPQELD